MWIAAAPFALAYVNIARDAGLSSLQTQLMSLSVYSAAAQVAIAQLMIDRASILNILLIAFAMHIHHILYGLSLRKHFVPQAFSKTIVAFPLTDFAYGVTMMQERNTNLSFLLGVEVNVFLVWNVYTATANFFAPMFHKLEGLHLDFTIPLIFFMLLIGTIKHRIDVAVAIFAIVITIVVRELELGGLAIPIVSVLGPLLGIGLTKHLSVEG